MAGDTAASEAEASGTAATRAAVFIVAAADIIDLEFVADSREHRAARFDRVSADSAHGVPGEFVGIPASDPADSIAAFVETAAVATVSAQPTTGIRPASDSAAIIT